MKSLILATALLSGCAAAVIDPTKMTEGQLKAWASDKNANVVCVSGKSVTGNVTSTYVVLDKGTVVTGQVVVSPDCQVSISSEKK